MTPTTPQPDVTDDDTDSARRAHPVTIHVNEQPVRMPDNKATGREIKATAIEQGVRIEADFILVEEVGHGGRTKVIGDDDLVHLKANSRFLANDGDDDS